MTAADPAIRPQVRVAVAELEADNQQAAQRRQGHINQQDTARRRAHTQARQAAIDACPHCDEHGWTLLGAGPEVRCDHPADPPPQQTTVPAAVSRAAIAAHLTRRQAERDAAAAAQRRQLLEQARAGAPPTFRTADPIGSVPEMEESCGKEIPEAFA